MMYSLLERHTDGLEEEIQKFMSERWEFGCINPTTPVYLYNFTTDDLKEVARHFAEWQKKNVGKGYDSRDMYEAYEQGRAEQKAQMMKDVAEGEVVKDISNKLAVTAKINLAGFKFGQKVKIIILKDDDAR